MVLEGTPRFAGCVVLTRLEGRRDIKSLDQAQFHGNNGANPWKMGVRLFTSTPA